MKARKLWINIIFYKLHILTAFDEFRGPKYLRFCDVNWEILVYFPEATPWLLVIDPSPICLPLILGSWKLIGNHITHTLCSRNRYHYHHYTNIHKLEIFRLDLRNMGILCSLNLEQGRIAKKIYALVSHLFKEPGSRNEKARSFNTFIDCLSLLRVSSSKHRNYESTICVVLSLKKLLRFVVVR